MPLSLVAGPALIAQIFGLVVNGTASAPLGIWRKAGAFTVGPAARGRYVLFCPPNTPAFRAASDGGFVARGRCPGGYVPLIKQVMGVPGDTIEVADGVIINGVPVANGGISAEVAAKAGADRPRRFTLAPGQLWMMSTYSGRSFDSRYFGPIESTEVEAFVDPLVVRQHWPRAAH